LCAVSRIALVESSSVLAIPRLLEAEKHVLLRSSTDIIIPVYNGMEFLPKLLESIIKNTRSPYRLIIIDDASPDERVWPYLQEMSQKFTDVTLLKNDKNRGFVSTCNRAMGLTRGHFIICNTDVEVPPGWLERLLAPIYSEANVATVTPFTNAGTICSFPTFVQDNKILNGWPVEAIDAFFAHLADPPAINIPTGVGFCMAFNRFAVKEIGLLDERTFERGYGEENDWCMRASARGYVHRMATNLFVYHKHGGSFVGEERARLRESNFRKLVTRYPDYQSIIDDFIRQDPAKALRDFLLLYIVAHLAERKTVLVVDHALGGGANLYREQLVQKYAAQGHPVLLLTYECHAQRMRLDFSFREYKIDLTLTSLNDLVQLGKLMPFDEVFYNNAVSYSDPLAVAEALILIKKATRAKLIVSFHDYFPVCPSYTLINSEGRYCKVPDDDDVCERCLTDSKPELVRRPAGGIAHWRRIWGSLIKEADTALCFSEDTARLVQKAHPSAGAKIAICPHKVDYLPYRFPKIDLDANLHIGVVGSINYAKGADVVRRIGEIIQERSLKIRITVVGVIWREDLLPKSVRVTGAYTRETLAELLERENINMCFLPSVWPETFSYVTEELMQLKMPLCCFDLGAPADRVRLYSLGRILLSTDDPNSALDEIIEFYECLQRTLSNSRATQNVLS
jgi:GT2 family glycosyltransferase/glycosyltransferase involved in cell wall biosynthesis